MNQLSKCSPRFFQLSRAGLAVMVAAWLLCGPAAAQDDQGNAGQATNARADARPAEEILAEIYGLEMPVLDESRREDAEYMAEHDRLTQSHWRAHNKLAQELYSVHPDHELAPAFFSNRIFRMLDDAELREQALREANKVITADSTGKYAEMANYAVTIHKIQNLIKNRAPQELAEAERVIEDYIASPTATDEHAAQFLMYVAVAYEGNPEKQVELFERRRHEYPNSHYADDIEGMINLARQIGKEFELQFDDAVTGKHIDLKDYRGKVVIIDCWATWCGPCIAEFPKLLALQDKYGDDLAIIGVSFDLPEDQGGLQQLRDYVKQNNLPWPQHYSGDGKESAFGKQWGIGSLPSTLIIDRDGKLVTGWAAFRYHEYLAPLLEQD